MISSRQVKDQPNNTDKITGKSDKAQATPTTENNTARAAQREIVGKQRIDYDCQ